MFAENEQISPRQIGCIAVSDWIGKFSLLIPWCLPGISGLPGAKERPGLAGPGLLLGFLGAGLLALLVCRIVPKVKTSLFAYIEERGGKLMAGFFYLVCLAYLLLQSTVMLRLCASAARRFFLPEFSLWILIVPLVLAGIYQAAAGIEVRGRMAEIGCPFILILFALLLLLAVFGIDPAFLEAPSVREAAADWWQGGEYLLEGYLLFGCFGGSSLILLAAPDIRKTGVRDRLSAYLYQGLGILAVLALAVCVIGTGTFGQEGFQAQEWPIAAMMSSVEVPGGFLQRWDILFLSILFLALFQMIGTGLYGCGEILKAVCGKKRKRAAAAACGLLSGCAALFFSSDEQAVEWYIGGNFFLLLPVMVGGIFLFSFLERARRGKRRRRRKAAAASAALLLVSASISGCGGRELEERLFISAMQIEEKDGRLEVVCSYYAPGGEEQGAAKDKGELLFCTAGSPEEIRKKLQEKQTGYVDFSHTKAVLMAPVDTERMKAVMLWMEQEPAFARNLLVYPIDEEKGLTLEQIGEKTEESAGTYLESLWENADEYRDLCRPLGQALGLLHKEWAKGEYSEVR